MGLGGSFLDQYGPGNNAAQDINYGPEPAVQLGLNPVRSQLDAVVEIQTTSSKTAQQQNPLFSSILGFDREFFKEAMAKTLENLIRGEGSTSIRRHQPSRRPKRLRVKPNQSKKTPGKEISVETLTTDQDGVFPQDKLEGVDPMGEDARGFWPHKRVQIGL